MTGLALAMLMQLSPAGGEEDAWRQLDLVRQQLTDQPSTLDFTQTFVPAGFTSGERETGRVSLALPSQLRWDYDLPFSRSFLLDGAIVYSWNVGESSGRRYALVDDEIRHLDLLRLRVDELRLRYSADLVSSGAETVVQLTPRLPDTEVSGAILSIQSPTHRLQRLEYSDVDGNSTRFEFSGHRPLADTALFLPPADLGWVDE